MKKKVCRQEPGKVHLTLRFMPPKLILLTVASCLVLAGCVPKRQIGESLVFIGTEPASLAHAPLRHRPLVVRNTSLPCKTNTVGYLQGADFLVDYAAGTVRRTSD